jgi:MscS family membrane protein
MGRAYNPTVLENLPPNIAERAAFALLAVPVVDDSSLEGWGLSLAALVMALAVCARFLALRVMDSHLRRLVDRTKTSFDNQVLAALRRSVGYLILLGGGFLALLWLDLPRAPFDWELAVWRVLNTLLLLCVGLLGYRIIDLTLSFLAERQGSEKKSLLDQQFVPLLRDVSRVALVLLVTMAVIQSWGYSPAGVIAGLGVGGLALAFAAQDAVANVFGSFIVFSDRPYKIGDWIKLAGIEGTVEQIGIRSTRIRLFDKALVSVPNKIVTNECIHNYSEMPVRRIDLVVRLGYSASPEQVLGIVQDIRALLKGHSGIDQEYWVVNFSELSTYSLDLIVYCFTRSTVWEEYLEVRQDLLLRIMGICQARGAELAYPASVVYNRQPEGLQAAAADLAGAESRAAPGGGSALGLPIPRSYIANPTAAPQSDDTAFGMEMNRPEGG